MENLEEMENLESREAIQEESPCGPRNALNQLAQDGWNEEELKALCADEQVHRDLADGLCLMRAGMRWLRRILDQANQSEQSDEQGEMPGADQNIEQNMEQNEKRRLPISQMRTGGGVHTGEPLIAGMSDAAFEAFSKRAQEAAMLGKRVRM